MDKVEITELAASSRITGKFFLVGFLCFALSILLVWLNTVIHDRATIYKRAEDDIAKAWSASQRVSGPYLIVPYNETAEASSLVHHSSSQVFLPEDLSIDAKIIPNVRQRGIFPIIVYQAGLVLQGSFRGLSSFQKVDKFYQWDQAKVVLSLSDLRGIDHIRFLVQDQPRDVQAGVASLSDKFSGVHVGFPLDKAVFRDKELLTFSIQLDLRGTSSLSFSPVARKTSVHMHSSWPDPSFTGAFLPYHRDITSQGLVTVY